MKHILALPAIAGVDAAQSSGQLWNSKLFPRVNGRYVTRPVSFAGRTWLLEDFSYVGYYLGTKSLGSVPCNVADVIATGDITQAVRDAIDRVGQAGGGIVRIPAGTFTMSAPVGVPYNNISIEGAGSGQTIIDVPSNYASEKDGATDGLFTFGRANGAPQNCGWVKGPIVANITAVVQRGDMQVVVDNTIGIHVGDWIVVQQLFWEKLVVNNSGTKDQWKVNTCCEFSFTYLRQVTAIAAKVVSLDAPIPLTLDPANTEVQTTPKVYIRSAGANMKENVGLKGMTIQFATQFAKDKLPSTGRAHGTGVYFEGVRNGWVYDVKILNFPRYGIYLNVSARITVLDCWIQTAQDKGGGGYGYGFLESPSQNILIKRCHGEDTRHNFLTGRPMTSMVVQTQDVSVNEVYPDDTHFGFSQAIVWDKFTQLDGASIEALNRGDESGGAYETLASGVIWNFQGDGKKQTSTSINGALYLKPSPDGHLIVVGVNGAHGVFDNSKGTPFVAGQKMPANAGLQVGTDPGALKNVLYEGLYQPGLQPPSLYEAQLANRIGAPPADWIDVCGTVLSN